MKLSTVLDGYWLEKKLSFSPHTIASYERVFRRLLNFVGDVEIEQVTNQAAFEALCTTAPKLVCEVRRLLALGQHPAQIEEHIVRKCGASNTTLYIRGAAEHPHRCAERKLDIAQRTTAHEVEADSVEDYLDRHYKPDRFRGRGEAYAAALIASYEREYAARGYCFTSHHDSICGQSIVWYGPNGNTK